MSQHAVPAAHAGQTVPPVLQSRHAYRAAAKPSRRRWRLGVLPLIVSLLLIAGSAVVLYPQGAQWFSDITHSGVLNRYATIVHGIDGKTRAQELVAARAYNSTLSGAIADPFSNVGTAHASNSEDEDPYYRLLAADTSGLMGRLTIPSLHVDLPIYHGTGDQALEDGIGHIEGTSLPVGGSGTHAVIAGHSGVPTSALFSDLDKLKIDDTFTIDVLGDVLTYRVTATKVVLPDDTSTLHPVAGQDLVTLVTCTPIGINSHRLLVTGSRIPTPTSAEEAEHPASPGFPWWLVYGGGVIVLVIAYLWWSALSPATSKSRRRERRRRANGASA